MGTKTNATKNGNYISKVGYLDIRQKTTKRNKTNGRGVETAKHELVICHGKNVVEGGFTTKVEATTRAIELLGDKAFNYNLN